jgi:sterol desaturase/sphingolipid hydroxylase (fatty acid hydroxylase superfamily)
MTLSFFLIWFAILVIDGVAVGGLSAIAASPHYAHLLVRAGRNRMTARAEAVNTGLNNAFSMMIFGSYFYFLGARTLYAGTPGFFVLAWQTLGVLLLYDLMYYFFHRAMHRPFLMRTVHGIHHQVRFPLARLSVYLHPLETLGGLGLLILAIVLLGPISSTAFLLIFLIHSLANIIVHSNLHFDHPAMGLFNFWVAKHDVHHDKFKYNYASIFPFWDMAFGTSK